MKVIATLSTIPSRIDRIRPTIESLLKQTYSIDKVEINVPFWCVRTAEPYTVPEWMSSMDKVEVHRTEDYGAITKVAPTLIRHVKEDVYVWSVDDDFVYRPTHLETLIRKADEKTVLCLHGGIWSSHGFAGGHHRQLAVDIVEGFFTILYPPKCIREDFLSYVEKTSAYWDNRKSDDIILSNYLAIHDIPRKKVVFNQQVLGLATGTQPYGEEPDALKHQDNGHGVRYIRVLQWLKTNNLCGWKDLPTTMFTRSIPTFPRPSVRAPYAKLLPKPPQPVRTPRNSPTYSMYVFKGKKKLDVKTNEQGTNSLLDCGGECKGIGRQ
jgi:hypothetical protein